MANARSLGSRSRRRRSNQPRHQHRNHHRQRPKRPERRFQSTEQLTMNSGKEICTTHSRYYWNLHSTTNYVHLNKFTNLGSNHAHFSRWRSWALKSISSIMRAQNTVPMPEVSVGVLSFEVASWPPLENELQVGGKGGSWAAAQIKDEVCGTPEGWWRFTASKLLPLIQRVIIHYMCTLSRMFIKAESVFQRSLLVSESPNCQAWWAIRILISISTCWVSVEVVIETHHGLLKVVFPHWSRWSRMRGHLFDSK